MDYGRASWGGQTSEAIFRERAVELKERLNPGAGYLMTRSI